MLRFPKMALRTRIFLFMGLILLLSGILILGSTSIQYESQREAYHLGRLDRKEAQIERHINHLVTKFNLSQKPDSLWRIHKEDFEKINAIHNVQYSLFTIEGKPLFIYHTPLAIIANNYELEAGLIENVKNSAGERYLENNYADLDKFHASYRLLRDQFDRPYGILFFPYFEDVSFSENELNTFLQSLYQIYLLLFFGVLLLSYFLSKWITRSLEAIRIKIDQTGLLTRNEKIHLKNATKEIDGLVNSYNRMIDDLEASAKKMAEAERKQAWEQMARQVAHEIKNPLTPMRLTVQSFQRRFKPNASKAESELKEFSQTLLEQIDTMSGVANAFSDFATLPQAKKKKVDLVEATRKAIQVFDQDHISFTTQKETIYHQLDRSQWIRVMTNLVHNAFQAVPEKRIPDIKIAVESSKSTTVVLIEDNGTGIPAALKDKIFEPKFTTKTGGMGLGLGIVKNIIKSHQGSIDFEPNPKGGTIFKVTLKR